MKRALKWILPILLVVLLLAYGGVSYLMASGVTSADRKQLEDHPSNYGLTYESVEFQSRRGDVALKGWYIQAEEPKYTIVFVHGIGGMRTADNATQLASAFAEDGFNSLLFDLRGHGESGGEQVSGGYFERYDVLGAYDFLRDRNVPADEIGFIGFSMGAATALLAAAEEPGVQALAVDSPYANVSELIARETARKTPFPEWMTPAFMPGTKLAAKVVYGIDVGELVPEKAIVGMGYPILVVHGEADDRIPCEHGSRLHEAAHPDSQLWLVPGVDHVDAYIDLPDEYIEKVTSYFESRIRSN
jgi:pimeloyl-ACP methyl ester carboxylesterase